MSDRGGSGRIVIPDNKLSSLLNIVYNVWFAKWRMQAVTMHEDDPRWDQMLSEAWQIMAQGEEYPVVSHLVITFLYELEARAFGGYSETTRNKILDLVRIGR